MILVNEQEKKDRLRSYANIFSRQSFTKLLQTNNLDFIDKKIERYDSKKLGKSFNTYAEYLHYAYIQLLKDYRCEYVYKNEIINNLLLKKYGTKNTIVINEFKVGRSVADMVLFNGTSKAFEIKTELDSERRLSGQINDYVRVFKECYIVTHESLVDKYLHTADNNVGLVAIVKQGGIYTMKEIRKATVNTLVDAEVLIRSLRTQEYKNIVKTFYGVLPTVGNFQLFNACLEQMKLIPSEILQQLYIDELKKRHTNTQSLDSYSKELRQLCLSMKIKPMQYQQLNSIINQPIKL